MSAVEKDTPRIGRARIERASYLPVIVAGAVGLFYTLGGLFKAAELSHAGYSVRDNLPAIPLSQLLARGVAVVWDNALAIIVFGAFFATIALLARWVETRFAPVEAVLDTASEALEAIKAEIERDDPDEEARLIKEEFEALQRDVQGREDEPPTEEDIRRMREIDRRVDAWKARDADLRAKLDAVPPVPSPEEVFGRPAKMLAKVPGWTRYALVLFAIGGILASTPAFAVGVWAPWLVVGVLARQGRRVPWYPHYIGLLVGSIVICQLVAAAVDPQPLSTVTLRLTGPRSSLTGEYIASTGEAWYVGLQRGRVAVVSASAVSQAEVVPRRRHRRQRLIGEYVVDAVR